MQLLEGEVTYFSIESVGFLMYKGIFFRFYWPLRIMVTSKRIIVVSSYFYNKRDYELYKKWGISFIKKHKTGKFIGEYIKIIPGGSFINPTIVIFTNQNKRLGEIITNANL